MAEFVSHDHGNDNAIFDRWRYTGGAVPTNRIASLVFHIDLDMQSKFTQVEWIDLYKSYTYERNV